MESAMYRTDDGKYAIPITALKSSWVGAAHKDIGIEKTLVKKGLFIRPYDGSGCLPMDCRTPECWEAYVRVGMGSTDLRYRPRYTEWKLRFLVDYDADLLQPSDIVNLINRAGFGVGIGEWRPERGGEYGRYEVLTGESNE
jgi:hypothetical protein